MKSVVNSDIVDRQTSLIYRPDIDGLRAVAVLAVLLFHAQLGLSGGFAGVDVFFVISGFLITSLILKDAESAGGFSILKFWERRIRRILPALTVVIVATVIGGWFILLPSHFLDLGKSVLAQAVFAGNFFFWLSSGYFAGPAALKPLLHTWSLAVEEQFYLFFPLLFLFKSKWKISSLRWVVGLLAIASLCLSITQTRSAPDAAFYLMPSRAWELFGGALLAMAPRNHNIPQWTREVLGWIGFLEVGTAFWFYNENTPFPGLPAVLPCMGTLMMIYANGFAGQPSTLSRMLSLRPVVFLGAISYSLYLWHWPILVYAKYWQDSNILRWYCRVGLLVLSLVLATLSWMFVEKPFRTRRVFPLRWKIFTFGLVSPACCALLGATLVINHGMPSRYPEAVLRYDAPESNDNGGPDASNHLNCSLDDAKQGKFPRAGKPGAPVQCLVWGDSHSMVLFPVFDKLADDSFSTVEFATHAATCPILDYESTGSASLKDTSKIWSEAVIENVRRKGITNVLLAANWPLYFGYKKADTAEKVRATKELADKLATTVISLHRIGAKVWILKTVPFQPVDVRMALAKAVLKGSSADVGVTRANYTDASRLEDENLAPAVLNGAVILNPSPFFFDNRERCLLESSGSLLYRDNNHLSPSGAMLLSQLFLPIFTK
jgi:peptidoglycan/LPS O-acetylase OafA/YrhL